jgi:hypothetical protein
MYSPKVSEDLIHRLYRQGQRLKRPMTKLVNEAVNRYLSELESEEAGSAQDPASSSGQKEPNRSHPVQSV